MKRCFHEEGEKWDFSLSLEVLRQIEGYSGSRTEMRVGSCGGEEIQFKEDHSD